MLSKSNAIIEIYPIIKANLIRHEGCRRSAYKDSVGKWTIGVGHLITNTPSGLDPADFYWSHSKINQVLESDIDSAVIDAYNLDEDFDMYPISVKIVIIDMLFNLGLPKLRKFKKMLKALKLSDWETMSDEMLDSNWAHQVSGRARYLASIIRLEQSGRK